MDNNTVINVENSQFISSKSNFLAGAKYALPIAVGYIPFAIAFGLLSESVNIPNHISILMSLMVYAGASQFMAVVTYLPRMAPMVLLKDIILSVVVSMYTKLFSSPQSLLQKGLLPTILKKDSLPLTIPFLNSSSG